MKKNLPPRHLIPRWRSITATLGEPEATWSSETSRAAKERKHLTEPDHSSEIEETLSSWRIYNSPGNLSDVLALSVLPQAAVEVRRVASEALKKKLPLTPALLNLARALAADGEDTRGEAARIDTSAPRERVRFLRQLLRVAPSNPLALIDLAQAQLVAGKEQAAERLLRTALQSNPSHRLVLRTLARFYVHIGQPDKAHDLLSRNPKSAHDPWLMASEIALSNLSSTKSRLVGTAQKLLKSGVWSPAHATELAGAVAGIELSHGKVRFARDLYRVALQKPNDNVLAQALFDQQWLGISVSPTQMAALLRSPNEALLYEAWKRFDSVAAERYADAWALEEPFSSRPIQFTSFLHIARGDYAKALKDTSIGLISNPKDGGLMANRAFSLAALGRDSETLAQLKKQRALHGESFLPYQTATLGFIELRKKNYEIADDLYETAISIFESRRDWTGKALCLAFYAQAAKSYSHPRGGEIAVRALDAQKSGATFDSAMLLQLGGMMHEKNSPQPKLRHATTWIYDPGDHSLTNSNVTGRPGAPLIVTKVQK